MDMRIELNKFGTTLLSRQSGKEALAAFQPSLQGFSQDERVGVSFAGVTTFSPSWGDEFLSPLQEKYGENLILHTSANPSVVATLEFLEEVRGFHFTRER